MFIQLKYLKCIKKDKLEIFREKKKKRKKSVT